ncbi:MAG: class I SAM-dependent methyltransferase [Bacteroidales bacterium]|nr:class I SAM-dependent methyltransferase [Bacteroidales bacterium]
MNKSELRKVIKKAQITDKYSAIRNMCRNCEVLDVGCVGQDANFQTGKWLHNEIKAVAKKVTGVDIDSEKMERLKKEGYHLLHVSELDENPEFFDIIVMADVIEHVSDPVGFLKSYSRFLKPTGKMIISTPNANRAVNFFSILLYNNYSVNDEHTCWFCPLTLAEVIQRAELKPEEFYWLKKYYDLKGLNLLTQILTWKSELLARWRKNFSQNFMMIVAK